MVFFTLDPEEERWSRKFCIYRVNEKIYHKNLVLLGNYFIHNEENVFFLFEDKSHIPEKTLIWDRKSYIARNRSRTRLGKRVQLGSDAPEEPES